MKFLVTFTIGIFDNVLVSSVPEHIIVRCAIVRAEESIYIKGLEDNMRGLAFRLSEEERKLYKKVARPISIVPTRLE